MSDRESIGGDLVDVIEFPNYFYKYDVRIHPISMYAFTGMIITFSRLDINRV